MTRRRIGISPLPSGQYRWRVMINGCTLTGVETTAAAAALARATAQLDNGGTPDHDPPVRDILEAHYTHSRRAETTLANWRWALDRLPDPFLDRRASEVTPRVVAALWRQMLTNGAPPHLLIKASNLCSTAWRDAYLPNVWHDAPPPTPPASKRIDPPSEDDVDKLITVATELDAQFGAWLTVAAFTGARAGEVCGLKWSDVDLEHGELLILRNLTRTGNETPGKTGVAGQRKVPLNAHVIDAITGLDVSGPWLFPRGDGEPMRPDGAAKRLQRVSEAAAIPVSPHQLRHFFVTQTLADGWSVPDVAAVIGDSPKTVLQTYAHWIPARSRAMVDRLGERVRGR